MAGGKFDIIGITETWAHNGILDAELTREGYNLFRKDRQEQRGGGVVLYIKDSLKAVVSSNLTDSNFQESMWCMIRSNNEPVLIGVIYRSPNSKEQNNINLLSVIEMATKQGSNMKLLLMGNFNFPQIDFNSSQVAAGPGSAADTSSIPPRTYS